MSGTKNNKIITVSKSFLFTNFTIGGAQTIVTNNIIKEADLNIDDLRAAVNRLVDRNPILSGTLMYGNKVTTGGPGVYVQCGQYDQFVHLVPTPKDIPFPPTCADGSSALEVMQYITTHIEPLLPICEKGTEELKKKLPVFGIHVMKLPGGYWFYAPRMSHAIGDGNTYYMVLEELNAILNNKANKLPPPITWESTEGIVFDFTHQAKDIRMYLALIMCGIVYAILGVPKPKHILLSREKILQKKKELVTANCEYLSTNDIVTAALCEQTQQNYKSVAQSVSYRNGRWPGVGDRDGGSITRLVNMLTNVGKDANQVRKVSDSLVQQPNVDLHLWNTFVGSVYNQTNWASIQHFFDNTLYHSPSPSVVTNNPLPIIIIYQPNDQQVGLMCGVKNLNERSGLLGGISA